MKLNLNLNPAIFKAYDIRGLYPGEINEDVARQIGRGFVSYLKAKRVGVSRDMRVSSPALAAALIEGATMQGADVVDYGMMATDMLYFASVTDGLDGYIARHRQAVTNFGKVMDPIADKLMIAAALVSLVSLDRLDAWVAMVIIAREFAVSGLRIAAGQQGVVIPASWLGKLKTSVQVAAVLALIAAPDPEAAWVDGLVYCMVAATVVSGADYFLNFRRRLDEVTSARERLAAPRPSPPS